MFSFLPVESPCYLEDPIQISLLSMEPSWVFPHKRDLAFPVMTALIPRARNDWVCVILLGISVILLSRKYASQKHGALGMIGIC